MFFDDIGKGFEEAGRGISGAAAGAGGGFLNVGAGIGGGFLNLGAGIGKGINNIIDFNIDLTNKVFGGIKDLFDKLLGAMPNPQNLMIYLAIGGVAILAVLYMVMRIRTG